MMESSKNNLENGIEIGNPDVFATQKGTVSLHMETKMGYEWGSFKLGTYFHGEWRIVVHCHSC
jgi:hypothetical protein